MQSRENLIHEFGGDTLVLTGDQLLGWMHDKKLVIAFQERLDHYNHRCVNSLGKIVSEGCMGCVGFAGVSKNAGERGDAGHQD